MTKGKVVLVPFPFDDLSTSKVRPAVCLTNPVGVHRHLILGFITSRMPDVVLNPERLGYSATGLRVSSVLRLHRLMTVAMSLISRELGSLSPDMQAEVDRKLSTLFGLDEIKVLQTTFGALTSETRRELLKTLLEDPVLQEEMESLLDLEIASEQSGEPTRQPDEVFDELDE